MILLWQRFAAFVTLVLAPMTLAAPTTQPFRRSGPFLLGADISWVQEDEASGTVYFDQGRQQDLFQILKSHDFNAIRLRVFVNPAGPRGYAATSKEAYCDLPHTLAMAQRTTTPGWLCW